MPVAGCLAQPARPVVAFGGSGGVLRRPGCLLFWPSGQDHEGGRCTSLASGTMRAGARAGPFGLLPERLVPVGWIASAFVLCGVTIGGGPGWAT